MTAALAGARGRKLATRPTEEYASAAREHGEGPRVAESGREQSRAAFALPGCTDSKEITIESEYAIT